MNPIKEELEKIKNIYKLRKEGKTDEWSSYTECIECGKPWLWGIKDNLNFTCPDCIKTIYGLSGKEEGEALQAVKDDEVMDMDDDSDEIGRAVGNSPWDPPSEGYRI